MVKVEETYNGVTDKVAKFTEKFDSRKEDSADSELDTSDLQENIEE